MIMLEKYDFFISSYAWRNIVQRLPRQIILGNLGINM